MKNISIREVLNCLENGVTRTTDSKGYKTEIGSIEEKYTLSKSEVKEMFKHPLLANKKTKPPKSFILIDDITEEVKNTTSTSQEVPSAKVAEYGSRPASSSPSAVKTEETLPEFKIAENEEVTEVGTASLTQGDLA